MREQIHIIMALENVRKINSLLFDMRIRIAISIRETHFKNFRILKTYKGFPRMNILTINI